MEKNDLRIVFMGTPEFAVETLRRLVEGGYPVVGVVTMPDKAVGKHQSQLQASPVKQYALAQGLPVLQPEKLKSPEFIERLREWRPTLQIVVAFRMLPEVVWSLPPLGTINLHASLLPQYRGAAPINHAIMNGETETGVTTFLLTHEIDTGHILLREKSPIAATDNAGIVHDRLMHLGARLVEKTLDGLLANTLRPLPQSELVDIAASPATSSSSSTPPLLHPAPKIFKDTCRINWNQPAATVYNFIRGLAPYPGAWTELQTPHGNTLSLKVFETEILRLPADADAHALPAGAIRSDGKTYFDIAVSDGFLRILALQQVGKKRLGVGEFLRGVKVG
jgi:methionyl-tRNA formyltransferase